MVKTTKTYRNLSDEELKKQIEKFKLEIMKSQAKFGQASIGKQKEKGSSGSDIIHRLKKEIARINTILTERKKK